VALLLGAMLCLAGSKVASADDGADEIDEARTALEKWVETRRILSAEKRDWVLGREMLNERIELVQREIDSLRERIRDAEASIAEADKKRAELIEENEALEESSGVLATVLVGLENRTRDLLRRLPDPVRERIQPLSQRIPEDPEDTRLSVADRFMNVVGILNDVNKFNREITVTSEVRTLPDGASAAVTALYVGIGQAYYVNADATVAGIGTPSPEGWVWKPANEAARAIADAVAILENEKVAEFVRLPIRMD
jgi:hypothetical protein